MPFAELAFPVPGGVRTGDGRKPPDEARDIVKGQVVHEERGHQSRLPPAVSYIPVE
jgi:hypothetical protein